MSWGVTLKEIQAQWDKKTILENINFKLSLTNHSSALPLMGPSGAGKSTLLYLMTGLKWPSQGKISWRFPDGKEFSFEKQGITSSVMAHLRRKYFGFAFQNSTLSDHLNIAGNLSYPLYLKEMKKEESRQKIETVLRSVLLPEEQKEFPRFLEKYPSELSGGQQQRVALAQSIIHDPYVIFADEPTGNLDLRTREQIMQVLLTWLKSKIGERMLVWVTHHEDDFELMQVPHRLFVSEGTCCYQRFNPTEKQWFDPTEKQ